jgi:nicotinate-nucleotide adenylyltransferase
MNVASDGKRVAFFGGSFDPPHLGHLAVARAATAALKLDTVLFAPVGAQPLKPQGSAASFEDRVAMTRLAVAGEPDFAISLADTPRPGGAPNFTLETLEGLRAAMAPEGMLFCLMGADSFIGMRRWHRAAEIPFAAPLIVASRPGESMDGVKASLPAGVTMEVAPEGDEFCSEVEVRAYFLLNQAGERAPFYLLPGLDVEISASEIRAQLRGTWVDPSMGHKLLPEAVADYIQSHGLYR